MNTNRQYKGIDEAIEALRSIKGQPKDLQIFYNTVTDVITFEIITDTFVKNTNPDVVQYIPSPVDTKVFVIEVLSRATECMQHGIVYDLDADMYGAYSDFLNTFPAEVIETLYK